MLYSEEIDNKLYKNLGKLFYAVAWADKKVNPVEANKLKECVRKYWLLVNGVDGGFGIDVAYQIEVVFDRLEREKKEGTICFQEFIDFFREHPQKFNQDIKQLIWKTADEIAFSFSNKNKSELIILSRLKILLR